VNQHYDAVGLVTVRGPKPQEKESLNMFAFIGKNHLEERLSD
jgi:hypothetical protein